MKLTSLVFASCVLLPANTALAQAGGSDALSGTWTGDIGLTMTQRHSIRFDLKFDGRAAVTGTVTGPGAADFKTGTFDPTTGALKLEVDVKDDGSTPKRFVFEGTAVNGTATGRVNDGSQIGSFRITRGTGEPAAVTQPGGSDAAAELRRSFDEVSGNVTKSVELVPADKYTYRPAASVRTFGQLIGHIADSYNYYCARAAGRDTQWSDAIEKGSTSKATLTAKLKQSLDVCSSAYAGAGRAGALIDNIGHTNLHYGNIITYLRMMGLVPPSS
jgi:uncharacterized damage-inducible protein DinB